MSNSKAGRNKLILKLRSILCAAIVVNITLMDSSAAPTNAILPGYGIGQVRIGMKQSAVEKILGEPTNGEGGMGTNWYCWMSRGKVGKGKTRHGVFIRFPYDKDQFNCASQIRVTSPWFKTQSRISTGSTFALIRKKFPRVQLIPFYKNRNPEGLRSVSVYDDVARGIAFEIANVTRKGVRLQTCVAIVVHPRGRSAYPFVPGWWDGRRDGGTQTKW